MSGLPDIYIRSSTAASPRNEGVYIRQAISAITNIYQLANVWANQLNYSFMASLYLYRDLLDYIVGLNLMIKMFLMSY